MSLALSANKCAPFGVHNSIDHSRIVWLNGLFLNLTDHFVGDAESLIYFVFIFLIILREEAETKGLKFESY